MYQLGGGGGNLADSAAIYGRGRELFRPPTYSRLITFLKFIDAPIQVPNLFYLTVKFKFLNFSLQIFLLFVPEMSANFTSYIV